MQTIKQKTLLKNSNGKALWAFLFWLVVATAFLYPLVQLLIQPFIAGSVTELVDKVLQSSSIKKAFFQTLIFAVSVTLISTLLGLALAWLLTRSTLPLSRKLRPFISFPYAIPPFIGAIAWIYLANPTNGLLNHFLGPETLNIYSMTGLIFVEMSFLYTFVFLSVTAALENMDASLEEAARVSGASPWKVFFHVTLPLIRPSLLSGSLLVFLACLASFGVPAMIGGPARLRVMSTEIFFLQKMGTQSGLQLSIFISGLLFIFSLLAVCFVFYMDNKKSAALLTGKTARPSLIDLGWFKWPSLVLVLGFIFTVLILPFSGILISALSQVQGEVSLNSFSFANFSRILFETEEVQRAFLNSLKIGGLASFIAVLISLGLAYARTQVLTRSGYKWLETAIAMPFSVPGTVLALALIVTFSQNFFGFSFSIYNTVYIFLYAYTLKYLHFSYKMVYENFRQIHPSLIEAAHVAGANKFQTLFYIWLPLLRPSLLASVFLIFVPSISELTMSVLLTGPGLETLGTTIFQLQEYSDNHGGGAASLSVLIILFIVVMNQITQFFSKGKYGL